MIDRNVLYQINQNQFQDTLALIDFLVEYHKMPFLIASRLQKLVNVGTLTLYEVAELFQLVSEPQGGT